MDLDGIIGDSKKGMIHFVKIIQINLQNDDNVNKQGKKTYIYKKKIFEYLNMGHLLTENTFYFLGRQSICL